MKKFISCVLVFLLLINLVGCTKKVESKPIQLPLLEYEGSLIGELQYNDLREIYAYIDNVGFEVVGNVQLYDPKTGDIQQVTSYEYNGTDPTVKKIMWLSENQLLMVVGFAMGTVTVGGSIHVLNIDTGENKPLIIPNEKQEIIDFVKPNGGSSSQIIFVVADWDENFMNFSTHTVTYTLDDINAMY